MEQKLRILIEKRNRDMVSEFEGTYLEVISALIYNTFFTLFLWNYRFCRNK